MMRDNCRAILRIMAISIITIILASPFFTNNNKEIVEGMPTKDPWMDIAIDDIEVIHTYGNHTYPNQTLTIRVLMGHDDDPFLSDVPVTTITGMRVNLSIFDGIENVYNLSKPVTSIPLDRYVGNNSTKYNPFILDFTWKAPAEPPGEASWDEVDFNITTELLVHDDDTSDNTMTGEPFNVSLPASNPKLLDPDTRERLVMIEKTVEVGDTTFQSIMILNDCMNWDELIVEVLSVPDGWSVMADDQRLYSPMGNTTISMLIQVSNAPNKTLIGMEYVIVLRVRSAFQEHGFHYPTHNIYGIKCKVNPYARSEVVPVTSPVYITPGEQTDVEFILTNTGNCPDSYLLSPIIDQMFIDKGWSVSIQNVFTNTITTSSSHFFSVKVTVPLNAPRYENANLYVNFTSSEDGMTRTSEGCTIFADKYIVLEIETRDDPIPAFPDKVTSFEVNVTNTGNTQISNISIMREYTPNGWNVFINQSGISDGGSMAPGETRKISIDVLIYRYTTTTEKAALPFIVIQASGGPYGHLLDEVRYYFSIPLVRNMSIDCDDTYRSAKPGELVSFIVNVTNEGNWLDSPILIPPFPWMYVDPPMAELAPGETHPFNVSGIVPLDMKADAKPETMNPDVNGNFDPYVVPIGVLSRNETVSNYSYDEVMVTILIGASPEVELTVVLNETVYIPHSYNHYRKIPVLITNTGNCYVKLDLGTRDLNNSLKDMITWEKSMIQIPSNGSVTLELIIDYQGGAIPVISIETFDITAQVDPTYIDSNFSTFESLNLEFVSVFFSIHHLGIDGVNADENDLHQLEIDLKYSFKVEIVVAGEHFFDEPVFDYFDLVLYNGGFEIGRLTVYSNELNVDRTLLTFSNITFDTKELSTISIKIENAKDDNGELVWEETIQVSTLDTYEVDDDDDDDGETNDNLGFFAIVVIFIVLIIFAVIAVAGTFRKKESEKDEMEE